MQWNFLKYVGCVTMLIIAIGVLQPHVFAEEDPQALQKLIEEKNKEMREIQNVREAVMRNLEEISETKTSLARELKSIDKNVEQVDLSIRENRVLLERLHLEIESLQRDALVIDSRVREHKSILAGLFFELQQHDRDGILAKFLRNLTFAESVSEIESLVTTNLSLIENMAKLEELQKSLLEKASQSFFKKREREQEQVRLADLQVIAQDQKTEKQRLLNQTKSQEQVYAQQVAELEKRQEEIGKFIEDVEQQLRASFDPNLLPSKRPGVFRIPVQDSYITQGYGRTQFAERAYKSKTHNGIDFKASIGTPVYAAQSGTVTASDNNDRGTSRWNKYQYGKYIIIEHENNLATLYAHLSHQAVKKGDVVQEGDLIGYAGNTGYATGPHLHFGVYWAPSIEFKSVPPARGFVPVGVTINPADYLPL